MKKFAWASFKRLFLYGAFLILVLAGAGVLTLHRLIELDQVKPQLEKGFSDFLQRDLTIDRLGWRFGPIPTLVGYDVRLRDDQGDIMAYSPTVNIGVSFLELRKGRLILDHLGFVRPRGIFKRRKNGEIPLIMMIEDIIKALKKKKRTAPQNRKKRTPLVFHDIVVSQGFFEIVDEKIQKSPLDPTLLINAKGSIRKVAGKTRFPFELFSDVNLPDKKDQFSVTGVLHKYPSVQVDSEKLSLRHFQEHLPFLDQWEGALGFSVNLDRKPTGLVWSAEGETVDLDYVGENPFPELGASFYVNPKTTSTLKVSLRGKSTSGYAHLVIPRFEDKSILGKLEMDVLDLEEVLSWRVGMEKELSQEVVVTTGPSKVQQLKKQGFQNPWTLSTEVDVSTGLYRTIKLENVYFDLVRSSDRTVGVYNLRANGLGGNLTGKAEINYAKSEKINVSTSAPNFNPYFYVEWDIKNMDIAPFFASLGSDRLLSGIGKTTGHLDGYMEKLGWTEVDGNIFFEVQKGVLYNVPSLVNSLTRLNARSLLTSDHKGKGLPFDLARFQARMDDGVMILQPPGLIESKTVHIGFEGKANFNQNIVDGKIVFQFLTVVGEVLTAVPGVREILYGKQKGLVPIQIEVKGDLKDPKINVLPIVSVAETVFEGIWRVLKIPFKPFEK